MSATTTARGRSGATATTRRSKGSDAPSASDSCSIRADLVQAIVADAEVVRDFVPHDALDTPLQVLFVARESLDRLLEDNDRIGQCHVVARAPVRERHAAIHAEQRAPCPRPRIVLWS